MGTLVSLAERHRDTTDFLTVYIREAHASDQWPLGTLVCIKQHTSIDERLQAAQQLIDRGFTLPLVCDTMDNAIEAAYAAWPERYLIIDEGGVVTHISQPVTEYGYEHQTLALMLNTSDAK